MTSKEVVEILHKRQGYADHTGARLHYSSKASGYRSYHVVVEYTVDTINGAKTIFGGNSNSYPLAMNFLGNDRTFSQLQVPRDFPEGD